MIAHHSLVGSAKITHASRAVPIIVLVPDLHLHSKKPGVAVISSANPLDNMEIHRIRRSEWRETPEEPGVYLLYGNPDGQLTAYVGMSTTNIKKRIYSHHINKKKNWFGTLFAMPLPLATICPAVEAELIYMIREAGVVDVVDNRSSEKRMHGLDDYQVNHAVDALVGSLELILGQDIFTAQEEEKIVLDKKLTRSASKTTVKDLLDSGLLGVGEEIVFTRNNINAKATINKNGEIVLGSESFSNPSAAASKAYGAKSGINGWRDWKTTSGTPLLDLREKLDNDSKKVKENLAVGKAGAGAPRPDKDPARKTPRKSVSASVQDLLDSGLLQPGETLYCSWHNRADKEKTCKVLPDGRIQTTDGHQFDSLSSAAEHLRGGATNGWKFWGVKNNQGTIILLADLREQLIGENT